MSFEDIDRNVPLKGTNLFSHSSIVREEAEKFRNNFERNERYKEFDGLIRKNHKVCIHFISLILFSFQLYEANDVFPHLKTESLKLLLDNLKKVDDRLKLVIDMRFNEVSTLFS
jgi:hypothetical protein